MCGHKTSENKVLGQRLNQSQGANPRRKTGISVSILSCRKCGLIYANPQPIPFDLQDHYGSPPEDYWKEEYFEWKPEYFQDEINEAKLLLNNKEIIRSLDIGAGLGKAMISMQKAGFDVYGLEPSFSFHEQAIAKMGIQEERLQLSRVEEAIYEKNYFDFITYGAVFEHLYDPAFCLERALEWLKPQGIIHIEVPSANWLIPKFLNLYYRLLGTNYVTNLSPMHVPYHMHEFDLRSFLEVPFNNKFSLEKYNYSVCRIYYIPKFMHSFFKKYMERTNTGMQLTVYLRKL